MRRRRNKAEYDDSVIGHADLAADLGHAQAPHQRGREYRY